MKIKTLNTIHPIVCNGILNSQFCGEQYKVEVVDKGYILYPKDSDPIFIPIENISYIVLYSENVADTDSWDFVFAPI